MVHKSFPAINHGNMNINNQLSFINESFLPIHKTSNKVGSDQRCTLKDVYSCEYNHFRFPLDFGLFVSGSKAFRMNTKS